MFSLLLYFYTPLPAVCRVLHIHNGVKDSGPRGVGRLGRGLLSHDDGELLAARRSCSHPPLWHTTRVGSILLSAHACVCPTQDPSRAQPGAVRAGGKIAPSLPLDVCVAFRPPCVNTHSLQLFHRSLGLFFCCISTMSVIGWLFTVHPSYVALSAGRLCICALGRVFVGPTRLSSSR